MNPKAITNFAVQFGVQIALNLDLIVEKNGRYLSCKSSFEAVGSSQISFTLEFIWGKLKKESFFQALICLGCLPK